MKTAQRRFVAITFLLLATLIIFFSCRPALMSPPDLALRYLCTGSYHNTKSAFLVTSVGGVIRLLPCYALAALSSARLTLNGARAPCVFPLLTQLWCPCQAASTLDSAARTPPYWLRCFPAPISQPASASLLSLSLPSGALSRCFSFLSSSSSALPSCFPSCSCFLSSVVHAASYCSPCRRGGSYNVSFQLQCL